MANKLTVLGQSNICRLRLRFKSLVKLLSLVGFCAGVGTTPIYRILMLVIPRFIENAQPIPPSDLPLFILFILIAAPVLGLLKFCSLRNFCIPALQVTDQSYLYR
jgi:hypothetical protein